MHIALLCGSFLPMVGGLEWKVHYLARSYSARGHAVTVISAMSFWGRSRCAGIIQPYTVVRFGASFRGMDRLGINFLLGKHAIRSVHRRMPIDLVHAHHVITPAHCAIALRNRLQVPVVLTPTGGDVQSVKAIGYGVRLNRRWDAIMKDNVRRADALTAINFDMAATLSEIGARRPPVYVPNGVEWQRFQGQRTDLLARRLGLAPDAFIFLAVGRNVPVKGYPNLLAAFAELRAKEKRAVLVVVGRWMSSLAALIEQLGLESCVYLIDELPMAELPAIFRSADAFVSASLMEGFPQVVAQAMASSLPCVLSDNPGHRAVASVGGALVVEGGPSAMAAAMQRVMNDPALARELAAAGHEGSRAYDWDVIARQYVKLFEEVRQRNS